LELGETLCHVVFEYSGQSAPWGISGTKVVPDEEGGAANGAPPNPGALSFALFGTLADRFITDELGEHHLVTKPAHSTKHTYKMYLRLYLKPRWSTRIATKIGHVEIQQWLKQIQRENDLSDPTLHRLKQLMGLVYAHGHWTSMIPKNCNPTDLVRTTSVS
jgi:hypothetical protein